MRTDASPGENSVTVADLVLPIFFQQANLLFPDRKMNSHTQVATSDLSPVQGLLSCEDKFPGKPLSNFKTGTCEYR